jgi:hypothetical protein
MLNTRLLRGVEMKCNNETLEDDRATVKYDAGRVTAQLRQTPRQSVVCPHRTRVGGVAFVQYVRVNLGLGLFLLFSMSTRHIASRAIE